MLYPIKPLMTREEMAQFDRLRYLEGHVASCHRHYLHLCQERERLLVMIGNNRRKVPELQAALAAVDPKNQRALKDAQSVLDAFVKQGHELAALQEKRDLQEEAVNRQIMQFYDERNAINDRYPVAFQALRDFIEPGLRR